MPHTVAGLALYGFAALFLGLFAIFFSTFYEEWLQKMPHAEQSRLDGIMMTVATSTGFILVLASVIYMVPATLAVIGVKGEPFTAIVATVFGLMDIYIVLLLGVMAQLIGLRVGEEAAIRFTVHALIGYSRLEEPDDDRNGTDDLRYSGD